MLMAYVAARDGQLLALTICYAALITPVFAGNAMSEIVYGNNRYEYEYKKLLKIYTGYCDDPKSQEIMEYNASLIYNTRQRRYTELQCTYLISCMWHMRLVQSMFASSMQLKTLIEILMSYGPTAQKQVATLVDLNANETKSMWQLYLYTQLLGLYPNGVYCDDPLDPVEDKNRLIKIHETVLKEIQLNVGYFCPPYNEFELRLPFKNNLGKTSDFDEDTLMAHTKTNIDMINSLMDHNEKTASVSSKSFKFLSLQSLYFNDFGWSMSIDYIVIAHNVQIDLKDFPMTLESAWRNSRYLSHSFENLKSLTSYHTMCLDFVKVVLLRLTLKHILYLNDLPCHTKIEYIKEWSRILLDFIKFFELSKDEMFVYLSKVFINDPVAVIDEFQNKIIRNEITSDLTILSTTLGFEADSPMVLDGNEFIFTYYDWKKYLNEMSYIEPQNSIQTNSIECAKSCIALMKEAFANVDFKVIRKIASFYGKASAPRFKRYDSLLRYF